MFCASCLPQTFPSSYRSDRSEQLLIRSAEPGTQRFVDVAIRTAAPCGALRTDFLPWPVSFYADRRCSIRTYDRQRATASCAMHRQFSFFVRLTGAVSSSRPASQRRRAQTRSRMAEGHRRGGATASCVLGMPSSLGVKVPCAT